MPESRGIANHAAAGHGDLGIRPGPNAAHGSLRHACAPQFPARPGASCFELLSFALIAIQV